MQKVLIIGGSEKLSGRISAVLKEPEFRIFLSGGTDGLKIAIRYLPDLILFCASGVENETAFIREFFSNETLSIIPFIVIDENNSFDNQRKAMESGADDYIPEGFLEKTLLNSVNQRMKKLSLARQTVHNSINSFGENGEKRGDNDHILIKIGNKLKLVEYSDIVCITALKEYSRLITKNNTKIVVRKSLKTWVTLLPKAFLRIHRATIININFIEEVTKTGERTYTVHLRNIKETFDFSHRYANIMRRTFPT